MSRPSADLVFLKLGGSLITNKRQPETPRTDVIARLAEEIASARSICPDLRLVVGHGSGSFGHVVGRRYGTRAGVESPADWYGFAATADAAARLNRIVVAALLAAGVPAWAVQPSVALRAADGVLVDGPDGTVEAALEAGLVPVVFGDVALDYVRGGTIASTEEVFQWLASRLAPERIILAGEVDGIYSADPQLDPAAERFLTLSPSTLDAVQSALGASFGVDVTGGMTAKVAQALTMIEAQPGLTVRVMSGLVDGAVERVLSDQSAQVGTLICG
jgi:isopentenyl phosphate kinase